MPCSVRRPDVSVIVEHCYRGSRHTVTGFKITSIRLPRIIVLTVVKSYGIERQIWNINSCFLKIAYKEQVQEALDITSLSYDS